MNMLEARIVDAQGRVIIANKCQNSDLFYAMRGGGHGFGVVVSLTVRTHPIPDRSGGVIGTIQSKFQLSTIRLIEEYLNFYKYHLDPLQWGGKVIIDEQTII